MIEFINSFFLSKITVLLINAVACFLAFLVYKNNPKGKINILYLTMTILMFFWVDFAYLPRLLGEKYASVGFVFLKIAWFATPIFFTVLYLLTVEIISQGHKHRILSDVVVFLGILSSFFTISSNCVLKGIKFIDDVVVIEYGPCMLPFLLTISFIVTAILFLIFRKKSLSKETAQYFAMGVLIFCFANIVFNIILPVIFNEGRFYFVGDYSILILLMFTAYGILRYNLFNIKIIATEILVFSIWTVLLVEVLASGDWKRKGLEIASLVLIIILGILLVHSVKREIRAREKMEEITKQLRKANRELRKLDAAKSEFISITSHQLRTPLTVIKGYISMMLEGVFGKIDKELKDPLKRVYESNERLISLVEDFLNISRIESGRLRFEFEECHLEDIIESVVEELRGTATKKGLSLRFQKEATISPLVRVDKEKMRQVIMNLVDNAIKYTEKGSITLFLYPHKNKLRFCVVDTGIGLNNDDRILLFKKFSKGYRGGKINATSVGLGLYIAKKIVRAHKGKIWAESKGRGKGSRFCFEIPIVKNKTPGTKNQV